MASSNKTPFLNLNKWLGTDKPKREDFNLDNERVDAFLQEHSGDQVKHVTAQERERWNSPDYVIGTYEGNNVKYQAVNLGFKPVWGVVFMQEEAPVEGDFTYNNTYANMAFFTRFGCSLGVELTSTGFNVYTNNSTSVQFPVPRLNVSGQTYTYIAYKERQS